MKHMEEAVNEICKSMENDPDRWKVSSLTVKDLHTGIEYWHPTNDKSITSIWRPEQDNVFSYEQGKRIVKALKLMMEYKASVAQEKVIAAMKPKSYVKSWWEFWK